MADNFLPLLDDPHPVDAFQPPVDEIRCGHPVDKTADERWLISVHPTSHFRPRHFGRRSQDKNRPPLDVNQPPLDLNQRPRTETSALIFAVPPRLHGTSIFTRTFGSHRFLRARISPRILKEAGVFKATETRKANQETLLNWVCRPIFILGRVFSPIFEKSGVVFYFLEGPERIGEAFDNGGKDYGITECTTVQQLIDWWIPFKHNGDQGVEKLITRLELGISDTLPGVFVEPQNIERVPDILGPSSEPDPEKHIAFTDGAGLMSPSVSKVLNLKHGQGPVGKFHMAYQIRLHTAKGVLLVDPYMLCSNDFNGPHQVRLYDSMCKARRGGASLRPGPVNGLHILDAACCILCMVKPAPSSSASGARLSAQFISILDDCGVPPSVFINIQADALNKELALWMDVTTESFLDKHSGEEASRVDMDTQRSLARLISKTKMLARMTKKRDLNGMETAYGYGRSYEGPEEDEVEEMDTELESEDEETDGLVVLQSHESQVSVGGVLRPVKWSVDRYVHNGVSGLPALKEQQLCMALLVGLDPVRTTYWRKIWKDTAQSTMQRYLTKFHLPVERSASGFLQPDPTGHLAEGEVCFAPSEQITDPDTGAVVTFFVGNVVVGRHPALLSTDMRKVRAVRNRVLEQYKGILFFSVKGELPLASILAGGDYDGDEGTIIWDSRIVEKFINAPLEGRHPPPRFSERFIHFSDRNEPSDVKTPGHRTKVAKVAKELMQVDKLEQPIELAKHLVASVKEGDTFKIYSSFLTKAVHYDGLRSDTTVTMAQSFNILMDNKKSGKRIKDKILAEDKVKWSFYSDPMWRQTQRKADEKQTESQEWSQKSPEGKQRILNNLITEGETELKRAMEKLKKMLEPEVHVEGNLFFSGKGFDAELTAPWNIAKIWAGRGKANQDQLDLVQTAVEECFRQFNKINRDSAQNRLSLAQRLSKLRALTSDFASSPSKKLVPGLAGVIKDEELREIKASYAYYIDMNSMRGGMLSGFAWNMAMRDLCRIKATARHNEDTVTMGYETYERLEISRIFAKRGRA